MNDKEYDGFLLVRSTYKVRCQNSECAAFNKTFKAKLGKEPELLSPEADGADYCPVCGALSLVADRSGEKCS